MTEEVSGPDTDSIEFEDCGSVFSGDKVVAIVDPEPEVQNVRIRPAIRALFEELNDLNFVTSSRGKRQ